MLKKIDNPEILTIKEACEKYRTKHIGVKVVKQQWLSTTDDDKCIVRYTVDSYRERFLIPTWDDNLLVIGGLGVTDIPGGSFRVIDKKGGDDSAN